MRNMRKVPKIMASNSGGVKKSPYANKNPKYHPRKAYAAKVPSENTESLPQKTYTAMYGLQRPPTDEVSINRLGDALVAWSRLEDSIIIEEFSIEKGISPTHFRKLREKSEYFEACYALAKASVGARRERIVGRELFKAMHPLYHDEYSAYIDHRSMLGKDDSDKKQDIHVHIEQFPNSNLVPVREE